MELKFSDSSTCGHQIFIKDSDCKDSETRPKDKTVLVCNVPPYVTGDGLRNAFSDVGKIERVEFQKRPGLQEPSENIDGFKVAYVVFRDVASVIEVLKVETLNFISSKSKPCLVGLDKWIKEYNNSICDHAKLEAEITKYMLKYDKQQEKKQKEEITDDDGWTVVTKKGRNPGLARKESVTNKLLEKHNKGFENKCKTDFYAFQKREEKLKRIQKLKKQFEEDKKKVELLKKSRKFKPY